MKGDYERWKLIEEALGTPELHSDQARLIAIGGIVESRKPYTARDVARTKVLAEKYGWERERGLNMKLRTASESVVWMDSVGPLTVAPSVPNPEADLQSSLAAAERERDAMKEERDKWLALYNRSEQLRDERDKWLAAFNRSEQFQDGPTKRAETAEAYLLQLRALVQEVESDDGNSWSSGAWRGWFVRLAACFPKETT